MFFLFSAFVLPGGKFPSDPLPCGRRRVALDGRSEVLVNGQLLKPDEVRRLKHFDRLLFGRATWMKRVVGVT